MPGSPVDCLFSGEAPAPCSDPLTAIVLAWATEKLLPRECMAELDRRVDRLCLALSPVDHAQVLYLQRELGRPVPLGVADPARRQEVEEMLSLAGEVVASERLGHPALAEHVRAGLRGTLVSLRQDPGGAALAAERMERPRPPTPEMYEDRPADDWERMYREALKAATRILPRERARDCAMCAMREVARWDYERRKKGEKVRTDTLVEKAYFRGARRALDELARNRRHDPDASPDEALEKLGDPESDERRAFEDDALGRLAAVRELANRGHRLAMTGAVLEAGDLTLAVATSTGQDWPSPERIRQNRSRGKAALLRILASKPPRQPVLASLRSIEALAAEFTHSMVRALDPFWPSELVPPRGGDDGSSGAPGSRGLSPGAAPPSPDASLRSESREPPMSDADPEHLAAPAIHGEDSPQAAILRAAAAQGPVPDHVLERAVAGEFDPQTVELLLQVEPARMGALMREHEAALRRVRAEVGPAERHVMVRLMEGFRSLVVQLQGQGLTLVPGTLSPATRPRKEDGWQLDLPGEGKPFGESLRVHVQNTPGAPRKVDLRFSEISEHVAEVRLEPLDADPGAAVRRLDVQRCRGGLDYPALRTVPVGRYLFALRLEDGNETVFPLDVQGDEEQAGPAR